MSSETNKHNCYFKPIYSTSCSVDYPSLQDSYWWN